VPWPLPLVDGFFEADRHELLVGYGLHRNQPGLLASPAGAGTNRRAAAGQPLPGTGPEDCRLARAALPWTLE